MMHMNQPLHPPHLVAPGVVNEETSAVICRMMEKNPDDRYGSYDELIAELTPLAHGSASAATATNTPGANQLTPTNIRHKTYR
jgi:serine/threonine protein kinase